jgi:hypothetical protein
MHLTRHLLNHSSSIGFSFCLRFDFLTAMKPPMFFRVITPYCIVRRYRRFGETYCRNLKAEGSMCLKTVGTSQHRVESQNNFVLNFLLTLNLPYRQ